MLRIDYVGSLRCFEQNGVFISRYENSTRRVSNGEKTR